VPPFFAHLGSNGGVSYFPLDLIEESQISHFFKNGIGLNKHFQRGFEFVVLFVGNAP
jgi:hypothetical protein